MVSVKATTVGAFVLGGIGLGVLAILLFGGIRLFEPTLRAVVMFKGSVAGLSVGAPVTFRGVQVGSVQSMTLEIDQRDLTAVIPVYLNIDPKKISWVNVISPTPGGDLQRAVKAGLRAELRAQSLVTGQLSLNLDFRPGTPYTLSSTDDSVAEIPPVQSDLERLKDQLSQLDLPDLADKTRRALIGVENITEVMQTRLGPLMDSVRQTSDQAGTTLQTTNAAVHALQVQSVQTLVDVDRLAVESRQQVAVNGKDLDLVLTSAARDTAQAEKLLASLNDLAGPYAPMRADLESSLRDLAASSSSLRDLTRNLERHPGATLLGGHTQ